MSKYDRIKRIIIEEAGNLTFTSLLNHLAMGKVRREVQVSQKLDFIMMREMPLFCINHIPEKLC